MEKPVIYTVGHSTRSIDEFLELLLANTIEELVDVRTIPGSRRHPQFGSAALAASLAKKGIAYRHIKELGGLRKTSADSPNQGWRNASFRGYADYMGTSDFAEGLEKLMRIAREKRTAIMCAEAVPWRCHRSLIADALSVAGWNVQDVLSPKNVSPHRNTPFLHVADGKLTYPKNAAA